MLIHGYTPKSIRANVEREILRGEPSARAIATSLEEARRAWRHAHPRGPYPAHLRGMRKQRRRRSENHARGLSLRTGGFAKVVYKDVSVWGAPVPAGSIFEVVHPPRAPRYTVSLRTRPGDDPQLGQYLTGIDALAVEPVRRPTAAEWARQPPLRIRGGSSLNLARGSLPAMEKFETAATRLRKLIAQTARGEQNEAQVAKAIDRLYEIGNMPEVRGEPANVARRDAVLHALSDQRAAAVLVGAEAREKARSAELARLRQAERDAKARPGTYEHELAVQRGHNRSSGKVDARQGALLGDDAQGPAGGAATIVDPFQAHAFNEQVRRRTARKAAKDTATVDMFAGTRDATPVAPTQPDLFGAKNPTPREALRAFMAEPPSPPPRNAYKERKAARIDRLRERAAAKATQAESMLSSARKMGDAIPFGQPILVGHYSEGRDRRYRGRMNAKYEKSFETQKEAQALERRARAAETNTAISSDDPEAVVKLRAELAELQQKRALMVAANKIIRKHKDSPDAAVAGLATLGFGEARARQLLEKDFAGRVGFADYEITNSGANARRLEKRIEELTAKASAPARPDVVVGAVTISEADNRVRMHFPGKPSDAARARLKSSGFRWSPTEGAWQRMASNQAWYHATEIANALAAGSL